MTTGGKMQTIGTPGMDAGLSQPQDRTVPAKRG